MKQPFSTEFLPLSECVHRLVQGMWGNVRRPQPIHKIKEHERDLSVGFGPQKEYSAALLRAAALAGKLRVYVRPRAGTADKEANGDPQLVPPEILRLIIPVHRGLPAHPTHVRTAAASAACDNPTILSALRQGQLVVRRSDFNDWYEQERARGNWPSQTARASARRGRPSTDVEPLRQAILALVHNGAWKATAGIARLRRQLSTKGHSPPSCDTLARVVDRLHRLTGDESLRRRVRKPPGPRES